MAEKAVSFPVWTAHKRIDNKKRPGWSWGDRRNFTLVTTDPQTAEFINMLRQKPEYAANHKELLAAFLEMQTIENSVKELINKRDIIYNNILSFMNSTSNVNADDQEDDNSFSDEDDEPKFEGPPHFQHPNFLHPHLPHLHLQPLFFDPSVLEPKLEDSKYFDRSVVNIAAKSVLLSATVNNGDSNFVTLVEAKKISDDYSFKIMMCDDILLSASPTGVITRFWFEESFLPYIPYKATLKIICNGPIVQMILIDNSALVVCACGTLYKCSVYDDLRISEVFKLNQIITSVVEDKGILYVTTRNEKLYFINSQPMSLIKEPMELGFVVKSMKISVYRLRGESVPIFILFTENNLIIGMRVDNGTVFFRFECNYDSFFDIVYHDRFSDHTLFCVQDHGVEAISIKNISVSIKESGFEGLSAMCVFKHLLFLGSDTGMVSILNTKNKASVSFQGITNNKILSLVFHLTVLYIGLDEGIFCFKIYKIPGISECFL